MAQFDLTQNIEFEAGQEAQLHIENVEPTDVMTGDKNRSRFLPVKNEHAGANRIDMVVSFLMESGGFAIL